MIRKTKQVIIVRKDLDMDVGKISAQVAHASGLAIYKKDNDIIDLWYSEDYTKIVLAIDSETKLINLINKAKEAGLLTSLVVDKGYNVFNGVETITSGAIGPALIEDIDKLTKRLRVYS